MDEKELWKEFQDMVDSGKKLLQELKQVKIRVIGAIKSIPDWLIEILSLSIAFIVGFIRGIVGIAYLVSVLAEETYLWLKYVAIKLWFFIVFIAPKVRYQLVTFPGQVKRFPRRHPMFTVLFLVVSIITVENLFYVYLSRKNLPDIKRIINYEVPTAGLIWDNNGKKIIELGKEYREISNYSRISPILRKAIISAEDKRFYRHNGLDYWVIPRVVFKITVDSFVATNKNYNQHHGFKPQIVFSQGGSTITQQLVRLSFLSEVRRREKNDKELLFKTLEAKLLAKMIGIKSTNSALRKREEIRLSFWLEREFRKIYGSRQKAKEEILARFATFSYLGGGRYGFSAACQFYFNKNTWEFRYEDADKAALLAGMIKAPLSSKPRNLDKQTSRRNEVLELMAQNKYIGYGDVLRFKKSEINFIKPEKTIAPSAVGHILKEIKQNSFNIDEFFEGRIQVRSTINLDIQKITNEALENGLRLYEERHPEAKGLVQGSVVVLRNSDGAILAEVGGRNPVYYPQYNRAVRSQRQPGSAFKPFVYLTAFMNGWTLNDLLVDAPVYVSMGWHKPRKLIHNYDNKYKGVLPVRIMLTESRNAGTILLAKRLGGINKIISTAKVLGIKTPLQPYITTSLGASEVSLLELTNAYRAMASGLYSETYIIEKISDRQNKTMLNHKNTAHPLLINAIALKLIQEGLRGVIRIPSGTAHSLDNKNFPIQVMGKTGTTNNFHDALFVGSTYGKGGVTIGVRIGYDDNHDLGSKETGGRTALPIFKEIMLRIYKDGILGLAPKFPQEIENNIDAFLGKKSAEV